MILGTEKKKSKSLALCSLGDSELWVELGALSIFISHIMLLIMGHIEQRVQCTMALLEYSCPKLEESGKGMEVRCNCN